MWGCTLGSISVEHGWFACDRLKVNIKYISTWDQYSWTKTLNLFYILLLSFASSCVLIWLYHNVDNLFIYLLYLFSSDNYCSIQLYLYRESPGSNTLWYFFFFWYCAGQRLAPHYRTLGDLEWEVESTTVTHSSADWWDILLPLA